MSYALNQYNQPVVDKSDTSSSVNQTYMTQLSGGTAKRKMISIDTGVSGDNSNLFYDECVQLSTELNTGTNYYLHCKIKRLLSDQIFYIYLINFDDAEENPKTQYLKTITVNGGNTTDWVDFEIIFSPLLNFDCILFQLQRTVEDYRVGSRYATICYEELSKINNLITNKIRLDAELIKIGIQSHPGLMMCINGEEIHIGRSGIYEVRNGVITVNFLSIVAAATENKDGSNPIINPSTGTAMTLDEYLVYLANLPIVEGGNNTNSSCIFDKSKERKIDSFSLDYLYEEG